MKIDDYKSSLHELSSDELVEMLRGIRSSRAKPKASNVARKVKAEGKGTKNKPATKNQVLNLVNSLGADDLAALISQMEANQK